MANSTNSSSSRGPGWRAICRRRAQGQGDAHPGAAAQDAAALIQGKELVDVENLRLAGGVKPGGPAVRGQHDAVLVESCQGLGHRGSLSGDLGRGGHGRDGPSPLSQIPPPTPIKG